MSEIRKMMCLAGGAVSWVILAAGLVWALGALAFDFPFDWLRPWAAGTLAGVVLPVLILVRPLWRAKLAVALLVIVIMGWWFTLTPRQYRDWKTSVALTAYAKRNGDRITIHNVRNFDYRTVDNFTPRYETRVVDLAKLRGMDVFITYWGSPYMAHPIISFDFGDDGHLCFSIETRMEAGESYSAIGGLYRRFEQIYVVADERDVIRLRTHYRDGEDVYLYRLKARGARAAFLEYLHSVNELHDSPRWYNAVTNNCTTAIRHQRAASERGRWDWRMLVNGYADELLYERGAIDTSLPFAELKKLSLINPRAMAAAESADFSKEIREGLPGMD